MIRFKLYWDKDKETDWLNRMCRSGYAMTGYCLGFYDFQPCEPGEYLYQIDILDSWTGDKEDFAQFMEENHVEVLCQWFRWVFLRRKADQGVFEMYTDVESKIEQYRKIYQLFLIVAVVEAVCCFMQVIALIMLRHPIILVNYIVLAALFLILLNQAAKCKWKINQLKLQDLFSMNKLLTFLDFPL